jgi:hypothetical protein
MYCYYIRHIETNEEKMIFGHYEKDAFRRYNLNPNEWKIFMADYED